MTKENSKTDNDMLDAMAVIQEALIDLYLNVKVRSKDEINEYNNEDFSKERDNLYITSPLDLINYIQTSVEILMNIKIEDYLSQKKSFQSRIGNKLKYKKEEFKERAVKPEDEISKRLDDSNISNHYQTKDSKDISEKGQRIETDNLEEGPKETGGAGIKKEEKQLKTTSSQNEGLLNGALESSSSFIPFSNRTSLTHVPTIYEEVIQKYENDIRNHIRIEQQMKLHSDSVLNKLEDKEKAFDKSCTKIKTLEERLKELEITMKCEAKVLKEENKALKKSLEQKIEQILSLEITLKEATQNYSKLEKNSARPKQRISILEA
ncbi:unnamed protein product [Moneuplotes crassus]|uniref:Uncharacterized protein n=1 Tax=Euplotes crassus TaxID=5936 RepID=A0AAD1UBE1_EUPCR|nr:unnamed protein product [Moneuplotes crassus]